MSNRVTINVMNRIMLEILLFFILQKNKLICINIYKKHIETKYGGNNNIEESFLGLHNEGRLIERIRINKKNLSMFKRAFQSSDNIAGMFALDENNDSYSETKTENNAWWMVDLGLVAGSTHVVVYIVGSFLPYDVFFTMEKPKDPRNIPSKNKCHIDSVPSSMFFVEQSEYFDCPLIGQFVTIKLNSKQTRLKLKEVKVFGHPVKYCTDNLNPCDKTTTSQCIVVPQPLNFVCKCKEGYTKLNSAYQTYCTQEKKHVCDNDLLNPCEKYSTNCVKLTSIPYFKCQCKDGFIPIQNNSGKHNPVTCTKQDVCEHNHCDPNNSICVKVNYSYQCQCLKGYKKKLIADNPETYTCVQSDHPCFTGNNTCGPDTECIIVNNLPDYECVT